MKIHVLGGGGPSARPALSCSPGALRDVPLVAPQGKWPKPQSGLPLWEVTSGPIAAITSGLPLQRVTGRAIGG